jgi:glutamate-1-semialdehyde 2,1-aminomutase
VTRSDDLFGQAQALIPGGVNSPVRAFGAVGGSPRFFLRGGGAHVEDVDGRLYLDYVQSWGALLFGHARKEIVEAAVAAASRGSSFGAPIEGEVRMAGEIVDAVPSVEMVRLVSSGTEAAMSALRLARGATGRPKVVKFDGCYHGHADGLLAKAGSGVATLGLPGSAGVTPGSTADTIVLAYNDLTATEEAFAVAGDQVACVIVEPVAANMGVVPPDPGFLEGLRRVTRRYGSLLVFDEVITGFRLGRGGAQELFGVRPDLTCLGKIMGGGFPCAAFGGRADLMEHLAPLGPVYQAGTLSGNPVAVAAGLRALELIREEDPYPGLAARAEQLVAGLTDGLEERGLSHMINRVGSLFSLFFTDGPVREHGDVKRADHDRYARFFREMLERGVYLPPSGYEAWFLSTAHGPDEVERTVEMGRDAASELP